MKRHRTPAGSIAELAEAYDTEARNGWTSQRNRDQARRQAAFCRRMLSNRAAEDPTRIFLGPSLHLDVLERWCRQHGYQSHIGIGTFLIARDNEPPIIARPGQVLAWDGHKITITG